MTAAVLVHVYEWDGYVARRLDHIARRSGGLDFYVMAPDALELPPLPHRVVRFGTGLAPALAQLSAAKAGWWSIDCALYGAVANMPDYDFYFRLDADVALTIDLLDVYSHMRERDLDWLTLPRRSVKGWAHGYGLAMLATPHYYTPLMAMLLSARAIRCLNDLRYAYAMRFELQPELGWPFCESFVATTLFNRPDMRIGGIDQVANTSLFGSEAGLLEDDPRLRQPGHIFHAVLDRSRFIRKLPRIHRDAVKRGGAALAALTGACYAAGLSSEMDSAVNQHAEKEMA